MPGDRGSFTSETIDSLTKRIECGFRRTYDRNQHGGSAGPLLGMLCRQQIRWTAATVQRLAGIAILSGRIRLGLQFEF